jgi:hypothetical protein
MLCSDPEHDTEIRPNCFQRLRKTPAISLNEVRLVKLQPLQIGLLIQIPTAPSVLNASITS